MKADEISLEIRNTEDIVNLESLRSALKLLNNRRKLGEHPLAQLDIVKVRSQSADRSNDSLGKGTSLREIILDSIKKLKPNTQEPNYSSNNWKPFLILTERFDYGRKVEAVADTFGIGSRQLIRRCNVAIDLLADIILEWEEIPFTARAKPAYKPPFTAPTQLDYELVGRNEDMKSIQKKLMSGENISIALYGIPGVGKTALASELVHNPEIQNFFDGGILWARLGQNKNPQAILSNWALKYGYTQDEISRYSRGKDLTELIRLAIQNCRVLVVIDDAWDIETATSFLLDCEHCVYLLTTRQPGIAAKFPNAEHFRVKELTIDSGIELLKSMTEIAIENSDLAEELVTSVGGLPLAIYLMGHFLIQEGIENQPRRIKKAIDILKDTEKRLNLELPRIIPDYTPILPDGASISLNAVIAVSFETLDVPFQEAIYKLSVFPPKPSAFSELAATTIAQIKLETIDKLFDWGLVETSGIGRYTVHKTISDFAALHLDHNLIYGRFASYYLDFLKENQENFEVIDEEFQNVEFALHMAAEDEMFPSIYEGVMNIYSYLTTRGLYKSAETHMKNAHLAVRKNKNLTGITTSLLHLGRISINTSNYDRARNYLAEALTIARKLDNQGLICDIMQSQGLVTDYLDPLEDAELIYEECLAISLSLDDDKRTIQLLNSLGAISIDLAKLDDAEEYLRNGLSLSEATNNTQFISPLKMNLGIVAGYRGDPKLEESYYLKALEIANDIGYREDISYIYLNLGANANGTGKHKKAKKCFEESKRIAEEIGNRERICSALRNIGGAERRYGDFIGSEQHLGESLVIARNLKHKRNISAALIELGIVHTLQNNLDKAETYISEGLEIAIQGEYVWHICEGLIWQGYLKLERGEIALGKMDFDEANERAQGEYEELVAESLFGLAKAAYLESEVSKAKKIAQESLEKFTNIKHYRWLIVSQWLRDHFPDFEH